MNRPRPQVDALSGQTRAAIGIDVCGKKIGRGSEKEMIAWQQWQGPSTIVQNMKAQHQLYTVQLVKP